MPTITDSLTFWNRSHDSVPSTTAPKLESIRRDYNRKGSAATASSSTEAMDRRLNAMDIQAPPPHWAQRSGSDGRRRGQRHRRGVHELGASRMQIGASRGTLTGMGAGGANIDGIPELKERLPSVGPPGFGSTDNLFSFHNNVEEQFLAQPVQFEHIVPNFISKHVRNWCDRRAKSQSSLDGPNGAMGTFQNVVPGVGMSSVLGGRASMIGIVSPPSPSQVNDEFETHGIKPECVPSAEEGFAAVVMADVSGYSGLTSTLAERGPIGAEILGRTMKGYLDKIIQTILLHGGDIVKFAGDAVIFYWKVDPSSGALNDDILKGELVLKASYCCMDLLNNLGTYAIDIPDCATNMLRIHLGIGAGTIYDVHVGGNERWEHFIAGDAVNQLSHVLDLAKAGQLAMSHQALRAISSIVDVDSLIIGDYDKRCIILAGLEHARRKVPPPTPPENDELQLWDIVPPAVNVELYRWFINESALFKLQADINQSRLFRMESGLNELLSLYELRQVTTVFIRIGSLRRWETPAMLAEAQEAMRTVQEAIAKYEGSLRQFHVDEKGAVILCFFGLPPLAHENDASFGIKAALDVLGNFEGLFDDFSIGITTGVVSIGGVGNGIRTEYAVMGDSINMAARLMCHHEAKQSLLCDERSFNLCEQEFLFERLGETKVKGKAKPIAIFRPKAARPDAAQKTRTSSTLKPAMKGHLIGRVQEKAAIKQALQSHSRDEDASLLILEADGGQGLSTLVDYVQVEAAKEGCCVCTGGGTEMEKATSFYCFRDIVSELLNILNEAEADNSGLLRVKPKPIPAEVQVEEEPALEPSPSQMQNRSPTAKRDLWSVVTRSSRKSIAAHTMEDERKRLMSHRPSVNGNMGSIMDMPRTASLGSTALPNAGARGNGNLEQQQQQQQPPQSSNGGGIFSSTTLPRALRRRPTQVDERLLEDVPPVPAIPTLPKLPSQGEGVDTDGSAMTSVTSEVVRESTYEPNGMPTIDDTSNTDLADRKFSVTRPSAIITASGTLETTADGAGLEGSTPTTPADQLGFCEKAKLGMTKLNTSHSMANLFELIVPHEFHNLPSSTRNNVGAGGAGPSSSGFDPLTVISSQYASKLRVSQLSDLLTHIINAISASNPMALVLQEAQWLDNSSWDLLWDIINACHKVVVFIFTRPESYIENEECKAMLHKFKRLPRATSIAMGGLTVSETKEMIKSMFGTIVSDVGAHLAQKIHDRTGGNPLYIQSLVVALREAGQLRVDELGNLTIVGAAEKSGFDIEHMVLGYDLQSIILAQFDRLDRIFQLFLKVAAVLGQRFLVDDVMYFLSDLPGVKELFKRQIAKKVDTMDKYGFLQRVEADGNIGSGAGEASVLHYQFKSVMVRNCIYSMMVLSQRQQLHLIVALYYEKKIKQNEDNRHRLLIPLFEHYMEAGDNYRMKKIKYLSEVAHYYHDHHWPVETIKHYLMLMQTAEAVQADTGQIFFDHVKVAGWYRELGEAYFWKGDTETAERHLQESLWLLGYKVPQTSLSLWWRVRKEMSARSFYNYGVMNNDSSASYLPFAHLLSHKKDGDGKKDTSASSIGGVSKFFFDTNRRATGGSSGNSIEPQSTGGAGGTSGGLASPSGNVLSMDSSGAVARSTQVSANASGCSFTPGGANPSHLPLPSTQQDTSELDLRELISKDPKMELLHNVRLCYLTLAQIYLQTDQPKHHKYCVIKGLNISEQFPRTGLYGRFMAMAGARFWMHARRRNTALRYLEAATKYERTNGDVTNATYTTQHITQTLFLMGVWKVSIDKLELLISLCTLSGDFASRENALRTKSIQLFITGPRSSSLHTARELYGLSVQEDHWLGKFWGLWLIVANLLDLSASTPSSPNPPTGRPVSMIFSPTTSLLPGGPNRPVDLMTELTENFEAWQKVMGEIPSKYKELKHLRVLELGLLSKYELRMGRPVNSIELATELYGLLKDLMQPPIITTTSWIPTLGIFLALRSFFVAYDNGWISDRAVQTAVRKFCRLCCKWLSKITYWCMAEPLRRIVESLACLCSNRKWSAVKALKAGLDIKDVDDIVVVSAVLHMLVGRHEERRPDGRDHLGTARTMFRMLGATYEMERTEVEGNKI